MTDIKISIIIAVYNEELYIEKALQSVIDQTFKEYEVIIVDDGSSDNSNNIINRFCSKYPNFHLITQKNTGNGIARNNALSVAQGEYIAFLDGDDFYEPNFLEAMYNCCKNNNADISYCKFYFSINNKRLKYHFPFISFHPPTTKCKTLSKYKAIKKLISIDMWTMIWNKLYKRTIFTDNNIVFSNMYFEDMAIMPKIFLNANKVAFLSDELYNYRRHKGSITSFINANANTNCKKANDFIKAFGIVRNTLEKAKIFQSYRRSFSVGGFKTFCYTCFLVIAMHVSMRKFSGMFKNIVKLRKDIRYFKGKDFTVVDGDVKLPYPIEI